MTAADDAAAQAAQDALDLQRDLALSCQWQLARLQAMRDGASLAAEAVQDVRLQLLEQGPVTDVGSVLMAAVVTFVLESSLAGVLTKMLSQRVVEPLLRTALPQGAVAKREAELLAQVPVLASQGGSFEARMAAPYGQRVARATWLRYEGYVKWLETGTGETTAVAVGKAAFAGAQASGASPSTPAPSPGVELLAQVYGWCARHALAIQRRHVVLSHWAASAATDPEEIGRMKAALDTGGLAGLDELRRRWRLLCEACIWAALYAGPLAAVGQAPAFDPLGGVRSLGQLPSMLKQGLLTAAPPPEGIDERLVDYWTAAFGDFVAEQVAANAQVTIDARQGMRAPVLAWLAQVQREFAKEQRSAESAQAMADLASGTRSSMAVQ